MNPDLNAWMGQVPWVPVGIAAAVVALGLVASVGGKKKRQALVDKLASGGRSAQAASILARAGFTDVTNAGGIGNLPRS